MNKIRAYLKQRTTIPRYWLSVFLRAVWDTDPASKVLDKMIEILLSFIAAFIVVIFFGGKYDSSFLQVDKTVFAVLGVTLGFRLIVGFLRIPAEMDRNKQGEIDSGKQRIKDLEGASRAKLELNYDESANGIAQVWSTNVTGFRVRVRNIGTISLQNIKVKIEKTDPKTFPYPAFELSITHNESRFLNPSDEFYADVLETSLEGNDFFFYAKEKPLQNWRYPLKNYEILISVSGDASIRTQKWFKFSYDSSNTRQSFKFKESDRDEK